MDVSAGAQREVEDDPDAEEADPDDEKRDGIGKHIGDDGAEAGVLFIALHVAQHEGEIGEERGDRIRDGVADAVRCLGERRVVAEEHHHGHHDRGEDGPLGRGGADEDIDDARDDDEAHDERHAGEVHGLEERRALDGQDRSQIGPGEIIGELGAEEAQDDVGRDVLEGEGNIGEEVLVVFIFPHGEAVDAARDEENDRHEEDDALHERRGVGHDGAGLGIAQHRMVADAEEHDDDDRGQRGEERLVDGAVLFRREAGEILIQLVFGEVRSGEAGCHDLFRDVGAGDGEDHAGRAEEIVIDGRRCEVFRIDHAGRRFGEAVGQRVRHAQQEVGGEARRDARIGAEDAQQGMAAHAEENDGGHRRQDDESRIARHVAVDADENDDEGDERLRGIAQHFLHERGKEAALLRAPCTDDAHQHHGERGKGGEIGDGLAPHLTESVKGEEVDDPDGFLRARMDRFHAHRTEYGRKQDRDQSEENEKGDRIGQFVADCFDAVQETGHEGFLFSRHKALPFCCPARRRAS